MNQLDLLLDGLVIIASVAFFIWLLVDMLKSLKD